MDFPHERQGLREFEYGSWSSAQGDPAANGQLLDDRDRSHDSEQRDSVFGIRIRHDARTANRSIVAWSTMPAQLAYSPLSILAARTVLAMSIAIVRRPTPPGTGAYAPESSNALLAMSPTI